MNAKEEFIHLARTHIKRDGISELLDFLDKSDFYTAPASTRYHGSYAGGLLDHSINVFYALIDEMRFIYGQAEDDCPYSMETIAIVSLFHDLCKIGRYKEEERNVKMEDGTWGRKIVYTYRDDCFCMGHGAKSIKYVRDYMKLTDDELQAIYWHMGPYDLSEYSSKSELGSTYTKNTLAFALNRADMFVTYITENERFQ